MAFGSEDVRRNYAEIKRKLRKTPKQEWEQRLEELKEHERRRLRVVDLEGIADDAIDERDMWRRVARLFDHADDLVWMDKGIESQEYFDRISSARGAFAAAGAGNPLHKKRSGPEVLYMAHPLSADTLEGIEANIDRALRWLGFLARLKGIIVSAPWIAYAQALDDADQVDRLIGIGASTELVRRADGVVLVGGRISTGMAAEAAAIRSMGGRVIDLIELGEEPPRDIAGSDSAQLEMLRKCMISQGNREASLSVRNY